MRDLVVLFIHFIATRTRGLCRDRATTTCNLLDFNGTDSPFLIL
jgi:hypothetical protein